MGEDKARIIVALATIKNPLFISLESVVLLLPSAETALEAVWINKPCQSTLGCTTIERLSR